ncbi:MAG: hypothetical protein J0H73_14340 [Salana multivorans]|mgnify:CR=1 FL=1|uniref:hypothetical protein n=1 Tax=Salana multivorans TaxID=120377 RepID=UPI00095F22E9|nr:hypothetical protein [Salana multivorans]MBN8883480.1 hypothetical protein [Salana multivorans]OJX98669.1 MAG: hypothetical protein BGO96_04635 [Micrococcales bacterium 73-15]
MSPIDPRTIPTTSQVGTRTRDAAVTPRATDFLPPSNAGEAGELGNPHGPTVIAPGLHGDESVRSIRPGVVSDTPATQSTEELEQLAEDQPQVTPEEPEEPTDP